MWPFHVAWASSQFGGLRGVGLLIWWLKALRANKVGVVWSSISSLGSHMRSFLPYSVGQSSHKPTKMQEEGTKAPFSVECQRTCNCVLTL